MKFVKRNLATTSILADESVISLATEPSNQIVERINQVAEIRVKVVNISTTANIASAKHYNLRRKNENVN